MSTEEERAYYEKINRHPKLKARMEAILEIVESAEISKAAEAEQRAIEELRQMGMKY
ncbi:hypothetical protein [Candidatus Albibeggiatoa sp. nov. BB20]|uniref:hypothetical protein n=1 Tax=Candidatus Albibeggiatoa sp. nov. BB20 TaxID=3162723 RepID=UPI003365647D